MIVLDTSVWIEFLRRNDNFFEEVRELLETEQVIALEWIFGELLQGAVDKREREIIKFYWYNLPKIDCTGVWIDAGLLSLNEKLHSRGVGLIDCAIISAARKAEAKLWSLDKKLNSLLKTAETYKPRK